MNLDQLSSAVSRRNFMRLFGAGVTVAATMPTIGQQVASSSSAASGAAATPPPRRRGAGGADMGEMRQLSSDTVIISRNAKCGKPFGSRACDVAIHLNISGCVIWIFKNRPSFKNDIIEIRFPIHKKSCIAWKYHRVRFGQIGRAHV